jgi:DNA polymerase-3 subunit alpha
MEGNEILETTVLAKVEEVEEIKVITKLTMPSRKLKLKNELLMELEKCK